MACLKRFFVADQKRKRDFPFKQQIGNLEGMLFINVNIEQNRIKFRLASALGASRRVPAVPETA